jgi:hypothetical protein
MNWNETINARPGYVLYIEHDNGPHDVSIHNSLSGAEAALREFAKWIFGDTEEPVPDEDLVKKLAEFNEHVRVYKWAWAVMTTVVIGGVSGLSRSSRRSISTKQREDKSAMGRPVFALRVQAEPGVNVIRRR